MKSKPQKINQPMKYQQKYFGMKIDNVSNTLLGYSFDTSAYMTKSKRNIVNCYDQAAAVTIFGLLLGIDVQFTYSEPFGYINTTTLVGNIETNNPCSTPLLFDTSSTSMYPLIENSSGNTRNWFDNHAYTVLDDFVYDACAGAITGIQLYDYFNMVVDFAANHQHNLKYSTNEFQEDAGSMTHIILNNFTIS
jgi:hypothetical protein